MAIYVDRPGLELCYSAARLAVDRTLKENDSLFTPGQPIWSLTNILDLYDRFVGHPDSGVDTFETKFRRQFDGAPAATIQLAGELLYVHFLFPMDMAGQTKRTLINEVLSWSPSPVTVPNELARTLDVGFATVGMAYKIHRPSQLRFMLEFYKGWKQLDDAERARLLKDPWAFKTWVWDIPIQGAQSQREALLHIVHPETFENIVSRDHKRRIANAFHDRVTTSGDDVDRQLLEIRQSLTEKADHPINFYAAPLQGQWLDDQPPPSPPSPGTQPTRQRAWLVRGANVDGQNLVPDWLNHGYCSVRWGEIGDVARGTPRSQITRLVNEGYPDDPPGARRNHVGNLAGVSWLSR